MGRMSPPRLKGIALALVLTVGVTSFLAGCAFFTAQRVGTFVAKQAATHVVKKSIKKSKEDHDQKKEREGDDRREQNESNAE
jgi:hypothetical protein